MKNVACIWLALFCILSIIACRISWKPGSWMDKIGIKEDEPVAWMMLTFAIVLWFI